MNALINGKFIESDKLFNVINPYNGEIIDTVPLLNKKDVKIAIESANNAKKSLNEMSALKISQKLYDAYESLKDEKKSIAKLITKETGKPINDSNFEMTRSIESLKLASEEAKRIYGESIPLDAGLGGKGFFAFTQKVPLGLVVCITPFNYPVNLAIHKIGPAIAAKNTVILKPSLQAPLSALKLAEIINDQFPPGVINTVTGLSSEIGEELIINDNINKISFTGSVAIGKYIASKAGMKKLSLELGGNDPLIVLKDADIDKAVKAAISGSYLYSGQVCMGVKRIILDNSIAEAFISKFVQKSEKLIMGDPMNSKTDIGPLINENAAISVEKAIKKACDSGAKLLTGGDRNKNFINPTVLDKITPDMDIVVNETFGPVSPIIRCDGVQEAIAIANSSDFGLQTGVFTENIHDALKCANEIEAGSVMINKQPTFRTDNMPFGGFKSSGIGKEGIKYAVEAMTKEKLIALNLR